MQLRCNCALILEEICLSVSLFLMSIWCLRAVLLSPLPLGPTKQQPMAALVPAGGGLLLALGPPSETGKLKTIMITTKATPANSLPTISESEDGSSDTKTTANAFLCGTVKRPWGSNVVIAEKERVLKRVCNRKSAISKHIAWLKDIQNERRAAEAKRREELHQKEERMREFKTKQAMKRAKLFEAAADDTSIDGGDDCCSVNSDCTDSTAASSFQSLSSAAADTDTAKSSMKDVVPSCNNKPAWALTEEAAEREEEEREAAEEEDLLCFVDGLDFDEYSQDSELTFLMDQVKNRIESLQREKNIDEGRLEAIMSSELAALRAERFGVPDFQGIIRKGDNDDKDDTTTVASLAETVRSQSSAISAVHSHRSMLALITRSREKLGLAPTPGDNDDDDGKGCGIGEARGMDPPVCITHVDDARFDSKGDVSRLPFLNRNPAI